jgi:hypothetical protein
VLGDVADRLLGDAEDQLGSLAADRNAAGDVQVDPDAAAGQRVEQVPQRLRSA